MSEQHEFLYESPIGKLQAIFQQDILESLYWVNSKKHQTQANDLAFKKLTLQLDEYFAGKRTNFTVPLRAKGTTFQHKTWNALQSIPYGKTCSYGNIAHRIHQTKAYRAVGTANGANPITIIVPCHRVIASNGSLGGYTGGIEKKKYLLNLEKANKERGV